MSDFDREALKRSLQHRAKSSPFGNRVAAKRGAQQEFIAATRQVRQEMIDTLEGELKQAGVDLGKLRAALASNRKRMRDAVAARPRAAPSAPSALPAAAETNGRFRSLRALSGRAIPLDQPPSLNFLNEPLFFSQDGPGPTASVSIAPNNAFFRVYVDQNLTEGTTPLLSDFAFWYVWNNESDSAMLVEVSTALELYGDLGVLAADYGWPWNGITVRSRIGGSLYLGSLEDPFMESRQSTFADIRADSHTIFGDYEDWFFDNESHGLYLDGFLVQPNSTLVITVWTNFRTDFGSNDGTEWAYGVADFSHDPYRISCPGVVVIASPVPTIQVA